MFQNLFTARPQLLDLFGFSVYEQPRKTKMYIRHVSMVTKTVGTAVAKIGDLAELAPVLK